tara:strand:- start:1269 stop:2543 length:1275 start_codon:yes stop_codon:yes gene_type:complete
MYQLQDVDLNFYYDNEVNIIKRFLEIRKFSNSLIDPLEKEDLCLQGMENASPPKWHLGHTNWFFETIVLRPWINEYKVQDERWGYIFNSYYETFGNRHPRAKRGLLTRPSINEVMKWRNRVDKEIVNLINKGFCSNKKWAYLLETGIQHEQQHQELFLMDILDGFSRQPLQPIYDINYQLKDFKKADFDFLSAKNDKWISFQEGLYEVGVENEPRNNKQRKFFFDNESPCHKVWLEPFKLSRYLVKNIEYKEFINDGGYRKSELWMSEGWEIKNEKKWEAPRYWRRDSQQSDWDKEFTLKGLKPIDFDMPVRHVSWFEADAFARWSKARLPLETEWEVAANNNLNSLKNIHDYVWQWTSSAYAAYPGFRPNQGELFEYNGKFMSSQYVLKGSSYITPRGHSRNSYRNFFNPASRWVVSGLRLAK